MNVSRLLAATALVGVAGLVAPTAAFAQASATPDVAQQEVAQEEDGETNTVVVTGSRIRRANDDSPVPITTVTAQDIFDTGRISVGDVLADLPQLASGLTTQNSGAGLGTSGLSFPNLRNLGRSRTLTLINGRRQVSADIINGVFSGQGSSVDLNSIPSDLIESIDIVTGGSSSIYGSDAIAGVLNFKLKDNFSGVQLRGQNGVSTYGDAGTQYLSGTAGFNFAEDRGNLAVSVEYANQEDYYGSGRSNIRRVDGLVVVDTDVGVSSDDTVDRLFYRDLRSATNSLNGQFGFRFANTAAAPAGRSSDGSSFTNLFLYQPDGSLVPQTGTRIGLGPNGSFLGGNGITGREGQLLVLSPNVTRYAVNVLGKFEFSPAFVPFIEAKYVRTDVTGSQSGPFFSLGQTLGDNTTVTGFADRSYANGTYNAAGTLLALPVNREGIRLDNPYLSAQARAILTAQLTASINSGVNPNTGGAYTAGVTAAQAAANQAAALAQVAAGTFRTSLRRNYLDFGVRNEALRRETYRAVGGVRGDFFDDFNYELSANYGELREFNRIEGNVDRQRFLLAIDTAVNAAGQIVCRSQIDARYAGTDRGGNPARLAADIAACVPLNPFVQGSASAAVRNYLSLPTTAQGKTTQFVGSGFVSGSLEKLFSLPGGPIQFSIGGEYRRETLEYDLDDQTSAGYAFYNALPAFSAPAFEVKEAFGELSIPLVKDVPLLQELTISGSGRVADYKGGAGTVYAYSGDAIWRPVRDLLLRGAYSRAVRAPYIGAVYAPQVQNFTPAPNDPCSARNINAGSAFRAANCAAAGRPAGYDFVYTQSLETRSGGNPDLQAEKSDSLTLGGVYSPSFVPGLSISSDYYDIKVKDVITAVGAQQVLNLCYDSPTLDNPFCGLFQRAGAGGGPRGEQAFRVLEGSLLVSSANFARFETRGLDTNIAYNHRFGWGTVNFKAIWTHVFANNQFTDPVRPNFKNVINEELGNPKDQFNITADTRIGNLTLGYSMRWIGKQYVNTFEDYNGVNGEAPQNPDYAEFAKYPIVTYHDLRVGYTISDRYNLNFGVVNVGNTKPPLGVTGVGAGSGIYDNRGRYVFAGATAKF